MVPGADKSSNISSKASGAKIALSDLKIFGSSWRVYVKHDDLFIEEIEVAYHALRDLKTANVASAFWVYLEASLIVQHCDVLEYGRGALHHRDADSSRLRRK